jgi:acetolactate synthase-1/2/3 large subunit
MVRQWQEMFYESRYSGTRIECQPDFVKLAEAYGIRGMRIEHNKDVRKSIDEALAYDGPVVMDFRIDRNENVWPMVAPGAPLSEVMEGREI